MARSRCFKHRGRTRGEFLDSLSCLDCHLSRVHDLVAQLSRLGWIVSYIPNFADELKAKMAEAGQ